MLLSGVPENMERGSVGVVRSRGSTLLRRSRAAPAHFASTFFHCKMKNVS